MSVPYLVKYRSMTSVSVWAELMDIKSASIWKNLALANVEVLKELSNIGGAQWTLKRSECLKGNQKLSLPCQYNTRISILYSVPLKGLLFTNVSQTTYCIIILCFQQIPTLDEETLSSLTCTCMLNIINNELQRDLVYCIQCVLCVLQEFINSISLGHCCPIIHLRAIQRRRTVYSCL